MSQVRSLNRVILVGRVGRDPEITHIPNLEKDVAKFSIATNEGYMDQNKQWKDITEWHNIVAWGWNAQKVEKQVSKGAMVLIEGKLKTRKWQDKNGQERRSTEVHTDNIVILEKMDRRASHMNGKDVQKPYENQTDEGYISDQSPSQSTPEKDINEFPYDEGEGDPF